MFIEDAHTYQIVENLSHFYSSGKAFGRFQGILSDYRADTLHKTIVNIPLRVTNNDTKFNNVMIDDKTGEGICVIELDTVMPGSSLYDFGDSIRSGANPADEDEKDLSKVCLELELYESFAHGFLESAGKFLTSKEIELLPWGAKLMTFKCGIRFLADHLNGDTYFKVHREGHNLDRCRTQFIMVTDMEEKFEDMLRIVKKYS
jgi:hypothetical protein